MPRPANLPLMLTLLLASCGGDSTGASDAESGGATSNSGTNDTNAEGNDTNAEGTTTTAETGEPAECGDVPLTDWEQMMLDDHNDWRASVAPPAAEMHRVYWDRTIAQNAAAWVSSCDPDWPHSPEASRMNVGGYEVLGENLSYCAGSACTDHPEVMDDSGKGDGDGWWEERHDYDWQTDTSAGVTSHYTQLTSSNIYGMGCATQLCDSPGPFGWDGQWWWTICQYGPRGQGYWNGTKPYELGEGGLVEPPASVFDDHPGLCGP